MTDFEIILDLTTWAFLGGTVVPMLVGLLAKQRLHGGLKGFLNLVLSAVAGLIATAQVQDGVLTKTAIVAGGMAFVWSIGIHYGLLKPNNVTGSDGFIQRKTANVGIG